MCSDFGYDNDRAWGGGGDGIGAWRGGGDGAGVWAEPEVEVGWRLGGAGAWGRSWGGNWSLRMRMTVYILRRANFPTFGAMNEDAPGRGLFKFWAHMFDYRDGHIYGSHSLRRRSGTDHPNLVYWYSVASEPSLNPPNPRLTLRRRYKLQDNETLSVFHYLPALSTTAQDPIECSHPFLIFD
ncbi:hypothetical protein F2Q69_00054444 [Brassica cretica]|uniref:Uncharacterized protein n=1 Tax=Brassica cretica TaxID=69181 RepID=A0A8S9N073_BRACR|nr:hypothetical protein F2Q69_00054444 [Brassica cretica]